ncbi:hypothetical protein PF005_g2855 [Phytophthora fragariae]|uniref:Sm domain-containing protein n=1 Tax=Phytophthora fragariae TaxID=53985 RepID=A0A6A4AF21_9STRA|nr:hypothetical protein PF003_g109 [Phytophthora fragariae]KAE8947336.1 hypothetical protein PF009_g3038 [Phytophthora fragariae]KAE9027037.1 hypothetical protein PF011_g2223 [Phytophthora fragariae]KAE9134429.1 hypothetical protein PF010_g2474 [Phytophthora fragariae]KAE9134724.1 hypothetical protein PF007_g2808 [Phytophthora fragariae]
MDSAQMEAQLRAFYTKHNPGNDQNIAEIVRKFAGRERQLCAKLFKKYGEAPNLTSVDDQVVETVAKASTTFKYERNFQSYALVAATDSPLDFRSAQFDALKALQAPRKLLKLPVTTAHPLDNIQKCRHLLPESDANRQTLVARPKKASPSAAEVKAIGANKTRAVTATPSLFEQLADTYLDGPFGVLRRCFLERMRVFVVVRRVNSVRGTCWGFLKAFDKHMNLVLLDVTHEFVPHTTHARLLREVREGSRAASDAVFSAADRRRNRRVLAGAGGTQREYIKQLFIRGDNVVSVSAVAGSKNT